MDRQQTQTMTFARQMYHNDPQQLLRHFEDAVRRPYEYQSCGGFETDDIGTNAHAYRCFKGQVTQNDTD